MNKQQSINSVQSPPGILQVKDLKTHFFTFEGVAKAVDGINFTVNRGETIGLVGESGCGKTVTAQTIMGLIQYPPGKIVSGQILFDGHDLARYTPSQMRSIRGKRISMIFQEPMSSLNPVFTVGDQIAEMFYVHQGLSRKESLNQAIEMLKLVQIPAPEQRVGEYPHQLSGGMRQRAMIAMALSCKPELLIADEPTTALDVTIQAQIIDLMLELKEKTGTAVVMITHDLGVIAEMVQKVVVMYAGRVVEEAPTLELFRSPRHPYTQGLLGSIPKLKERLKVGRRRLQEIPGLVPSLYALPPGCSFEPRCPKSIPICRERMPKRQDDGTGHLIRCWLHESN